MSRQYFVDAPYGDPMIASPSAIVATVETGLWLPSQFSYIPAFDMRAGKVYRLTATGIVSTGASGTLTITPRFGNTTGGISLGASGAQTVPVSITNVSWWLEALLTVRVVGAAGANSTVICGGKFVADATLTAGTGFVASFGGTVVTTADQSASTNGLFIGWTLSVAGSVTSQQVVWHSLN